MYYIFIIMIYLIIKFFFNINLNKYFRNIVEVIGIFNCYLYFMCKIGFEEIM